MDTALCTTCPPEKAGNPSLSQSMSASVEKLVHERTRALAEQALVGGKAPEPTRLERSVDELLDTLHTLHRLEHLAEQAARSQAISVDADRLLIAEHEQTFLEMVEQARARQTAATITANARIVPALPTRLLD